MKLSKPWQGIVLAVAGVCCASSALAAVIPFPKTPAGRLAELRLQAFNSGSADLLKAFKSAHDPNLSVENELGLRNMTGGLDLVRISQNEPYRISLILRVKDGDLVGTMELEADDKKPEQVKSFRLAPLPVIPDDLMPQRLSAQQAWQKLTQKADKLAKAARFSGVIAVARDGVLLQSKSWGEADRERKLSNTMQTRFRMGSMYKMLTAVAILQLVEQDRLALDVPIARYLPSYPNKALANQVTIHQLLTHTAGTGDIFTEEYEKQRESIREHGDYVALFSARELAFVPGSKEEYSNYGYVLLGAIIEAVTGKSYRSVVQDAILTPTGMRDTGTEPESQVAQQISVGYTHAEAGLVDNRKSLPWRGTAAGGGYSTASDLIRFSHALLQGRLLSASWLAKATQAQTPSQLYAYGFQLGGSANTRHFGHAGGAEGMNGALRIYPATGDVVIALSNFDPPAAEDLVQYYGNRMPLRAQEKMSPTQKGKIK
jgi:D-alanyl-D-alanine carboxypeptidase